MRRSADHARSTHDVTDGRVKRLREETPTGSYSARPTTVPVDSGGLFDAVTVRPAFGQPASIERG